MNFTTEVFLENLCRTCMGESLENKTISIFDKTEHLENKNATIMELLLLTTPKLKIEINDMLPKVLCENCVERLINVHEYQEMCIRVEEKLRKMLNDRTALESQIIIDPLNDNTTVNQTINDLTNILKVEVDETIVYNDEQLVNNEKGNMKLESENNLSESGSSNKFEDDISTDKDSDWEFRNNNIPKT